jgi:hypothetical protein
MIPLFPTNLDSSRFGNKYKSLLTCLGTGIKTYANRLEGFEELLAPSAFAPPGTQGIEYMSWRLLTLHSEQKLLSEGFVDPYPERFDTDSPFLEQIYSRGKIIDLKYGAIPRPIQERICLAQEWIPWSDFLKQIFQGLPDLHRVLGVSVRSWTAPHDNNAQSYHRLRHFHPQKYIDAMRPYFSQCDAVFYSFDNPAVEPHFESAQIPLPRLHLTLPPLTPMQKAAVDAFVLGHCKVLLGDKVSTYPEVAWWLGKCKAEVVLIQTSPV